MKPINSKKTYFKILLLALMIIVLYFSFFYKVGIRVPMTSTALVEKGDIEDVVLASGTLTPVRQVSVGAQVNGQLKSLKVKLGDRVTKGQLLAEIDPILQQNELRRANASLENVNAQKRSQIALLRQYDLALTREVALRGVEANAVADLEVAKAQVDTTRANVDSLDAQIREAYVAVETAKANLAYTKILAPMDGEVIAVVTQEGQTVVSVQSAPTILVIADLDRMIVKAKVSEADVVRVHRGQLAWFSILGFEHRKFHSKLLSVEPSPPVNLSQNITTSAPTQEAIYYNALLEVDNKDRVLRPLMTAQVSILLASAKDTLLVSPGALLGGDAKGNNVVRVYNENANCDFEYRSVEVGINSNTSVQILKGLQEGEVVFTSHDKKNSTSEVLCHE